MPSIFRTAKSYWATFLIAWIAPMILATIVIWMLPQRSEIRSTIELATTFDQGRDKVIDAPEQVAKAAIDVYLPTALFGTDAKDWGSKEIPRRLRADVYGRTVSLSDRVTTGSEPRHVEIQKKILDQILAQQKILTDRTREVLDLNIRSAQRLISNINEQTKILQDRLSNLEKRAQAQDDAIGNLRKNVESPATAPATAEDNHYFRDRLWSAEDAMRETDAARSRLDHSAVDLSRQKEEQTKIIALNKIQLNAIHEATILVSPVAVPLGNTRKILFLTTAFIGSLFFAILVVLILDRTRHRANAQ